MATLSVCVIARDEEERLPRALASVSSIADEMIVVDSGSRDRTRELAAAAGARVLDHPWRGFAAQRNVALDHATGDWVLELDADEWCTPELLGELQAFLALPPPPGVKMGLLPMRQWFLGRELGPAGHYPFYRSRLFRRGVYRHDELRTVHEGLWPRERPWVFTSDLGHQLASGLGEALRDTIAYARLEATAIGSVSGRALAVGVAGRPLAKFVYQTVLMGAWRDGPQGLTRSALECLGDALTWLLALAGEGGAEPAVGHFGRPATAIGPVRLLAVGDPSRARGWLEGAVRAGAWVSVVCGAGDAASELAGDAALRIRAVPWRSPGAVLRAIDAEAQLGPVDAWVALDRGGALALRAYPLAAHAVEPTSVDPAAVVARVSRPEAGASLARP